MNTLSLRFQSCERVVTFDFKMATEQPKSPETKPKTPTIIVLASLLSPSSKAGPEAIEPHLIAELALWSASSDGSVAPEELEELCTELRALPGLQNFDMEEALRSLKQMSKEYQTEQAIQERVATIAQAIRSPKARRASYQFALWCSARDGQFTENESEFLAFLQECLEISDNEAKKLLQSMIDGV